MCTTGYSSLLLPELLKLPSHLNNLLLGNLIKRDIDKDSLSFFERRHHGWNIMCFYMWSTKWKISHMAQNVFSQNNNSRIYTWGSDGVAVLLN